MIKYTRPTSIVGSPSVGIWVWIMRYTSAQHTRFIVTELLFDDIESLLKFKQTFDL